MAKLHAGADGAILRLDLTPAEVVRAAPAGTAATLDFDPATNGALLANATIYVEVVRYDGTTVTIAGQPYAVQAASAAYTQEQTVAQAAAAFLGGSDLTLAQLNRVVRWLLRRELAR